LVGRADLKGRIAIDFVGIKSDVERRLLSSFQEPEVLRDIPQVPLTTAQAMMRRSSALLLFNPPLLARYIPGKAYEYIATGKRILLYGEGGELERLLSDYPRRSGCIGGTQPASPGVERHRDIQWRGGRGSRLVDRYSRRRRAAEHADMMDRLIAVPEKTKRPVHRAGDSDARGHRDFVLRTGSDIRTSTSEIRIGCWSCARVMPSAVVSLPGPLEKSLGATGPRRRLMTSRPLVGIIARSSTAEPIPFGVHTRFAHQCMP
jgi:hypothetical protein